MPAKKKFSHAVRYEKKKMEEQEGTWLVGWDYLLLFFAGMFSAVMTQTFFREVTPAIVDIATYQMVMMFGGMIFGIIATVKRGGGIGISVRPPTRRDAEIALPYVVGGFVVLAVVNRSIAAYGLTALLLVTFSSDMNIALTAAVAEEAVYSFGFTTFFYKISEYMTKNVMGDSKVQENVAMVLATSMVSLLFFVIHLAVYGTNIFIAAMLFINRFVYAIVYLRTKNLAVPTLLHLLHNFMTFV